MGKDAPNDFVDQSLRIKRYGEPVLRERKFVSIYGLADPDLGVYNSNVNAVVSALSERYFNCLVDGAYVPPLVVDELSYDDCCEFRMGVVRYVQKTDLRVKTRQEVVESYTGRKRQVYAKAKEVLDLERLPHNAWMLATFVKFEKMNMSKAPRIIQPRQAEYTLELARYLKHAEKRYYRGIAKMFGGPTVIKGYNASVAANHIRGMWDEFAEPVAIGLDATKFDMHVSKCALEFEHGFYTSVYRSRKLKRLLSKQLHNFGIAYTQDGNVKFEIEGTRSSGDINTSLGNCLIMCSLVYTWAKQNGVRIRLANNGDDCVVFMEREDLDKFAGGLEEWFSLKGFRMKVEQPVNVFERLEFCQSSPVWCADGWRMVRNVHTVLNKDAMCLMPVTREKDLKMWLGAVGECGLSQTRGVPVLEEYYEMYHRCGIRPTIGYMDRFVANTSHYERRVTSRAVVTEEARASFYYAFGVEPDVQRAYEDLFRNSVIDTRQYNFLNHVQEEPITLPTNHDENVVCVGN